MGDDDTDSSSEEAHEIVAIQVFLVECHDTRLQKRVEGVGPPYRHHLDISAKGRKREQSARISYAKA